MRFPQALRLCDRYLIYNMDFYFPKHDHQQKLSDR